VKGAAVDDKKYERRKVKGAAVDDKKYERRKVEAYNCFCLSPFTFVL
jgi:hypothetical protein